MTRNTRTGRRVAAGVGALQAGRPGGCGQVGDQAVAGRSAWAGGALGGRLLECGALAVCRPTQPRQAPRKEVCKEPWNEPSNPVGENDAIPIGPPQQAMLNTDETVANDACVRGAVPVSAMWHGPRRRWMWRRASAAGCAGPCRALGTAHQPLAGYTSRLLRMSPTARPSMAKLSSGSTMMTG